VLDPNAALLELTNEIVALHLLLAEAQDQCVEMAVDAGELQAELLALRAELAAVRHERDGFRERLRGCCVDRVVA
jgi:chromosome segregation ATPase